MSSLTVFSHTRGCCTGEIHRDPNGRVSQRTVTAAELYDRVDVRRARVTEGWVNVECDVLRHRHSVASGANTVVNRDKLSYIRTAATRNTA